MTRLLFPLLVLAACASCKKQTKAEATAPEIAEREAPVVTGNFSRYQELDTVTTVVIERHVTDLNHDGQQDSLMLENLQDLVGDPQTFTIIRAKLSGGKEFVFKDAAGYRNDSLTQLTAPNRIGSRLLYTPETDGAETLFFIWDFKYPDCTTGFEIIELQPGGFRSVANENMVVKNLAFSGDKRKITLTGTTGCDDRKISKTVSLE